MGVVPRPVPGLGVAVALVVAEAVGASVGVADAAAMWGPPCGASRPLLSEVEVVGPVRGGPLKRASKGHPVQGRGRKDAPLTAHGKDGTAEAPSVPRPLDRQVRGRGGDAPGGAQVATEAVEAAGPARAPGGRPSSPRAPEGADTGCAPCVVIGHLWPPPVQPVLPSPGVVQPRRMAPRRVGVQTLQVRPAALPALRHAARRRRPSCLPAPGRPPADGPAHGAAPGGVRPCGRPMAA